MVLCSELPIVVDGGSGDDDYFASDCLKIIGSFYGICVFTLR